MIKIVDPKAFIGTLMVEYRGTNETLLNSPQGHYVKIIKLERTYKLHNGIIENACFKFKIYGDEFLIVLDGCLVYLIKQIGDDKFHILLENWVLNGFRIFTCSKQFIITTTLNYNNVISETDSRQEPYNLTLNFKDSTEMSNLFS